MSVILKPTVSNIINLWFGADTPIRQYKVKLNPELWKACQVVNHSFNPPSKRKLVELYRKSDKVAFATAVLAELERMHAKSLAAFGQSSVMAMAD